MTGRLGERVGPRFAARVDGLGRWLDEHPWVGPSLAAVAWFVIVVLSSPWGRLWGTGQDAYCYWFPSLDDPYARSDWTDPIAYVYSPAFLQLLQPIRILPWQAYMAAWTLILLGALVVLTGRRWLAVGVVLGLMELAGGNIHLLIAAAIVLGFRHPWTWSIVLLTKITPGIGLLWFVVRREWRNLAIALGATAAIVLVSFVVMPDAWRPGARCSAGSRAGTAHGQRSPSRSSSGSRSPSRWSSGERGPVGAGRSRWPRCSRCRRCGTAVCRCSWRSSRCARTWSRCAHRVGQWGVRRSPDLGSASRRWTRRVIQVARGRVWMVKPVLFLAPTVVPGGGRRRLRLQAGHGPVALVAGPGSRTPPRALVAITMAPTISTPPPTRKGAGTPPTPTTTAPTDGPTIPAAYSGR